MARAYPPCAITLAAAALAMPAHAEELRGTVAVSLQVDAGCALDAGPLAFGTLGADQASTPMQAQAALRLRCTPGTPFSVTIDGGQNGTRRMADPSGASFAPYEIYQDPAGQRRWGSGTDAAISGIAPPGGEIALVAHARLTAAQDLAPARYSDVVTVMVAF